jgi:hypothetical protein
MVLHYEMNEEEIDKIRIFMTGTLCSVEAQVDEMPVKYAVFR